MSTFFTDRNLGRRFPEILIAAGLMVEVHDDHFEQTAQDDEILAFVSSRGWVMLTADAKMRRVPAEKEAIISFKARVIHLKITNRWPIGKLAVEFAGKINKVEHFLDNHPAPLFAVFRIRPDGRAYIQKKV